LIWSAPRWASWRISAGLPKTVGFAESQIKRQLDIQREAGHGAAPSLIVRYAPADVHPGTGDDALSYGVAHGNVIERAINTDIAHRRESGEQRGTGVRDGLVR